MTEPNEALLPVRKLVKDAKGSAVEVDASQILHQIITFDKETIENLGLKAFVKNPEFISLLDAYCEHLDRVGFHIWASDLRMLLKWLRINWCADEGKMLKLVIDALKSMFPAMAMTEEESESRKSRFLGSGSRGR